MKVGFIGAGKVGFTLGKYFCEHDIEVTGYYSHSIQSAKEAAAFTATDAYEERSKLVAISDVLFFTVPDDRIASCYEEVVRHEPIQGKFLCHCSGVLTADAVFPSIEQTGAAGYSVHPLFAISDRYQAYRELGDVFFTLEGTAARLPFMQAWLQSAGLHVQMIAQAAKATYHCAAAIASNQIIALFEESQQLLQACGFSAQTAVRALRPLFLGNAQHIAADGPAAALTGPVERGDMRTIGLHLDSLTEEDDKLLYLLLSRRLLKLAVQKHPERDYTAIQTFIADKIRTKG